MKLPKFSEILGEKNFSAFDDTNVLEAELSRRKSHKNIFPLDALPAWSANLNHFYLQNMEIERAYIGLSFLAAISTAAGSYFQIQSGTQTMPLNIWGALVGLSSSGKTMAVNSYFSPLAKIQREFDDENADAFGAASSEENRQRVEERGLIFGNATFESVVREILPDNPKGLIKLEDELLSWFNQMNAYKSGDVEKSFWTSAWSPPVSGYKMARTGKKRLVIAPEHLFINVFGGTQPHLLHNLFGKNNELFDSGFTFRILFAMPETNRVIVPRPAVVPDAYLFDYQKVIQRLYKELPVKKSSKPEYLVLSAEAVELLYSWRVAIAKDVNAIEDKDGWDIRVKSGAIGKIAEYAIRIAGILYLAESACYGPDLQLISRTVQVPLMERSIKICQYFFQSFLDVAEIVKNKTIIPEHVLEFAADWREAGSYTAMKSRFPKKYPQDRSTIGKKGKEYMEKYPTAFGAKNT